MHCEKVRVCQFYLSEKISFGEIIKIICLLTLVETDAIKNQVAHDPDCGQSESYLKRRFSPAVTSVVSVKPSASGERDGGRKFV